MPEVEPEVWAERLGKRQAAITRLKETAAYQFLRASRAAGLPDNVPSTPDPRDRCAKRVWEARVMEWRQVMRQWARDSEE